MENILSAGERHSDGKVYLVTMLSYDTDCYAYNVMYEVESVDKARSNIMMEERIRTWKMNKQDAKYCFKEKWDS